MNDIAKIPSPFSDAQVQVVPSPQYAHDGFNENMRRMADEFFLWMYATVPGGFMDRLLEVAERYTVAKERDELLHDYRETDTMIRNLRANLG